MGQGTGDSVSIETVSKQVSCMVNALGADSVGWERHRRLRGHRAYPPRGIKHLQ